jgi:hypothetical protein
MLLRERRAGSIGFVRGMRSVVEKTELLLYILSSTFKTEYSCWTITLFSSVNCSICVGASSGVPMTSLGYRFTRRVSYTTSSNALYNNSWPRDHLR